MNQTFKAIETFHHRPEWLLVRCNPHGTFHRETMLIPFGADFQTTENRQANIHALRSQP